MGPSPCLPHPCSPPLPASTIPVLSCFSPPAPKPYLAPQSGLDLAGDSLWLAIWDPVVPPASLLPRLSSFLEAMSWYIHLPRQAPQIFNCPLKTPQWSLLLPQCPEAFESHCLTGHPTPSHAHNTGASLAMVYPDTLASPIPNHSASSTSAPTCSTP